MKAGPEHSSPKLVGQVIKHVFGEHTHDRLGRSRANFDFFRQFDKSLVTSFLNLPEMEIVRPAPDDNLALHPQPGRQYIALIVTGAVKLSFKSFSIRFDEKEDTLEQKDQEIDGVLRLPGDFVGELSVYASPTSWLDLGRTTVFSKALTKNTLIVKIPFLYLQSETSGAADPFGALKFALRQRLCQTIAEKVRADLARRVRYYDMKEYFKASMICLDLMCQFGKPMMGENGELLVQMEDFSAFFFAMTSRKRDNRKVTLTSLPGYELDKDGVMINLSCFLPEDIYKALLGRCISISDPPAKGKAIVRGLHAIRTATQVPERYDAHWTYLHNEFLHAFGINYRLWIKHAAKHDKTIQRSHKKQSDLQMALSEREIMPDYIWDSVAVSGFNPAPLTPSVEAVSG